MVLKSSALHLTTTKLSTFKKEMIKSIDGIMRMSKTPICFLYLFG